MYYPDPSTYHLIESVDVYPNPACPPILGRDWYRSVETTFEGRVERCWAHWLGGGIRHFPIETPSKCGSSAKILQSVTLSEDQEIEDLDLSQTTPREKLLKEAEARKESSSLSGWLSPEGVLHPCGYFDHDMYAAYVLKRAPHDLTRAGWLRLDSKGCYLGTVAEAQAEWLLKHRLV